MFDRIVTLYVPNPQSGQTHSNNSSAVATRFAELFECVDHFAGLAHKGLQSCQTFGINLTTLRILQWKSFMFFKIDALKNFTNFIVDWHLKD